MAAKVQRHSTSPTSVNHLERDNFGLGQRWADRAPAPFAEVAPAAVGGSLHSVEATTIAPAARVVSLTGLASPPGFLGAARGLCSHPCRRTHLRNSRPRKIHPNKDPPRLQSCARRR